jgi:acetoacetyl-CoA synthetase
MILQYTHTAKRVEIAVKKIVNGAKLESINTSAVANPESLSFFVDHPDLRKDVEVRQSKL